MDAARCHCGADVFAGFDACHEHVSRTSLLCEVIRLRWHLHDAQAGVAEEHAPTAARRHETTILERM